MSERMRSSGLREAIAAVGSVSALARTLGVSQPSISNWDRVPAERVLAVEAASGVSRDVLRPDLYPTATTGYEVDEVDAARAAHYLLLANLLMRAPDAALLAQVARIRGDATPLGTALIGLAQAADGADSAMIEREFFHLFVGLGRGELLPYASYYLTGFLHDRPLARIRDDMALLGMVSSPERVEPEDHIATLCEIMANFAAGSLVDREDDQRKFFRRHLQPWASRFFAELEMSTQGRFYKPVGLIGRLFLEIEAQAFEFAH